MDDVNNLPENDSSDVATVFRYYGEFWNPDLVNWKNSYEISGVAQERPVDAYNQCGIYVLYDDYVPVYIGRAVTSSIGTRLQSHRADQRKGPRWDRFSWFGLKQIDEDGWPPKGSLDSTLQVKASTLIATLEALLILIVNPRMNSRREALKNAVKVVQSDAGKPPSEAEQQIAMIQQKLDLLMELSTVQHARGSKDL